MIKNEQILKLAKRMKVDPEMIVFADFLFLGYNEVEAYLMAYPKDETLSLSMMKRKRKNIVCSGKFKEICDERRELHERMLAVPKDISEIELIGSEEVAKEFLANARQQTPGSKVRAELYAKYYEIYKDAMINVHEQTNDTDRINLYFSDKCGQCLFFLIYQKHWKRYLKEHKGEEIDQGAGMKLLPDVAKEAAIILKQVKTGNVGELNKVSK
ncbi:MAG: hypothetical protein J6Q22_08805 [Prevotella sp.]|nr:hypothetical protein [Prevotella sp.]